MRARRVAGIKHPRLYATEEECAANFDAMKFNCAQRAHANTLEQFPIILTTTLITALTSPVLAASLCGIWSISRVPFYIAYSSGHPKKRAPMAKFGFAVVIGLIGSSGYSVISLIIKNM